jgi:hypothetical protein
MGHSAQEALAMAAPYVEGGVYLVAGMWMVGPASLAVTMNAAALWVPGLALGFASFDVAANVIGGGNSAMIAQGFGTSFYAGAELGSQIAMAVLGSQMLATGGLSFAGRAQMMGALDQGLTRLGTAQGAGALTGLGRVQGTPLGRGSSGSFRPSSGPKGGWNSRGQNGGNYRVIGRKSCFPAGTPVHTSVGLQAIEQIAVGDRVWAYDHRQLRWAEREVVEVYQLLHRGTMATIQVQGETLRATGGHPFWVVRGEGLAERPLPRRISAYVAGGRQEGRWVLACDLRAGDEVLLRYGEVVALESVRLDEVEEQVYNFHVAELQNYAVGGCGVLVHNTNDPPSSRPTKVDPDTKLDVKPTQSAAQTPTANPNIVIMGGKFRYRWPDGTWRTQPPPGGPLPPDWTPPGK